MAKYKEIRYGTVFPGANLTDFPKLIKISGDADIAAELSGGGGIELYLADGTTPVPFGLYPSTNLVSGDILMRVKISPLTAASTGDVMLRLRYGSGLTTVEDKAGVVSNNYALFMPLEEDPSGSAPQMFDWVTETNIGTSQGSMTSGDSVTGTVGKCVDFDGTDDYIDCGQITSLNGANAATLRAIITTTNTSSYQGIGRGNFASDSFQILFNVDGNIYLEVSAGFNTIARSLTPDSGIGTHAYSLLFDGGQSGTARSKLAIDGVLQTLTNITAPAATMASTTATFRIGKQGGDSGTATGKQDEVSISLVARSTYWDAYQYADEFTNSDTFSLSVEVHDLADLFGLEAYWKLDESSGNAIDAHGSSDLTDNNSVGTGTGILNGGRTFNGSNKYLNHSHSTALAGGDQDWTFTGWFKATSISGNVVLAAKNGSGTEGWLLRILGSGTDFDLTVNKSGSYDSVSTTFGNPLAAVDEWFFVSASHDSVNNILRIYVNGVAVTKSYSAGMNDGGDFALGYYGFGGSGFYNGMIDEAGFWHNYLHLSLLDQLYGSGTPPVYPFSAVSTDVTGTGACTLGSMTCSGSGTRTIPAITGTGTCTLGSMTCSGSGTRTNPVFTATGSCTLGSITCNGSGINSTVVLLGTGGCTLGSMTCSGSGALTVSPRNGTGACLFSSMTCAGTGHKWFTSTGTCTLSSMTCVGTGTRTSPVFTALGSCTLSSMTCSGIGANAVLSLHGIATILLGSMTCSGTGSKTVPAYTGVGACILSSLLCNAQAAPAHRILTGTSYMFTLLQGTSNL